MSNPSQLFLLADHIKLSLLERQRAISLNLDPTPTQSSHIARSLESFREGLEALGKAPPPPPRSAPPPQSGSSGSDVDHLQRLLRSQYNDLSRQFYGDHVSSTAEATITSPNDPALSADFDRAQQLDRRRGSPAAAAPSSNMKHDARKASKSVRFRDDEEGEDGSDEPVRKALFPTKYTDDDEHHPDPPPPSLAASTISNEQIHAYHSQVMAEQDEQLDRLGESIGRQRHLSMQMGDELEGQVALLDDVDREIDRYQGRLDGAMRRLKGVSNKARENWGMSTILVLIVILVLLIVILK